MLPTKRETIEIFSRFGLSRLYHIIIPPKTSNDKLPDMSHIVRSLRNYVDMLLLVQGSEHGRHYHGLCHFIPGKDIPTFTKFHLKKYPLVDSQEILIIDDPLEKAKSDHYKSLREENNFFSQIPLEAQFSCAAISCMIKRYFTRNKRAVKAKKKQTKKDFHIGSVYDYLIKNLKENIYERQYYEYQLINCFSKKKKISNILNTKLTNGISTPKCLLKKQAEEAENESITRNDLTHTHCHD